ncbi:hypothetical protein HPB51_014416 [Rhipicephalus microplus]|uniref:GST C-terminal domain-containing protein n=1 Tax=Rhipicephalus microplus TaxID=6941 RepID=A0A9J6F3X5_RHIMP|nr:hypothetical protein HPB51_014416 [Rhipicephalus microplus]
MRPARSIHEENLANVLKPWADHMRGRTWALGDRLTYVDFPLYEALDWIHEFNAEVFPGYPVLQDYLKRFEVLPNVKEYFASENYSKWPILGPMVTWGHFKE